MKKNAQKMLERIEKIDALCECKLAEQRQWRELAERITANIAGDVVTGSGKSSKSPMADAVNKCIDAEKEVASAVDLLIAEKNNVISILEKVDNPTEYRLLHLRYIQYCEFADIAKLWGKEYTTITTTHGRAIANVQRILEDGKDL